MTTRRTSGPEASVAHRRRQGALAGHLGDEAAARQAFVDPDPAVRAVGLGALVRMRALTGDDLDLAAADESTVVRRRVGELAPSIADPRRSPGGDDEHTSRVDEDRVRASGSRRLPEREPEREKVITALTGMLDDEDPGLVEAASFGIGETGIRASGIPESSTDADADADAIAKLCEIARNHPDTLCRESAVAALGSVESPQGLEVLLDAMGDKPSVRRRAVIALAAFESPLAHDAIERALADRDWQVRQAAEDLCGTPKRGPAVG